MMIDNRKSNVCICNANNACMFVLLLPSQFDQFSSLISLMALSCCSLCHVICFFFLSGWLSSSLYIFLWTDQVCPQRLNSLWTSQRSGCHLCTFLFSCQWREQENTTGKHEPLPLSVASSLHPFPWWTCIIGQIINFTVAVWVQVLSKLSEALCQFPKLKGYKPWHMLTPRLCSVL